MASLIDTLARHATPEAFRRLGETLGAEERTTRRVAVSALTAMLGALYHKLTTDVVSRELHRSVMRGYDGSLLDRLDQHFAAGPESEHARAADDLLGDLRSTIESNLARSDELSPGSMRRLTGLLVPVLMSVLARQRAEEDLDATQLADAIVRERQEIWQKEPQAMRSLARLLDDQADASEVVDRGIRALD